MRQPRATQRFSNWLQPFQFNLRSVVSVIFCISLLMATAHGLSCIQCNSMDSENCLHGEDLPAKPCRLHVGPQETVYCIKSVGREVSGPGHFVFRACSSKPKGNCTTLVYRHANYHTCTVSCAEDGCNEGSRVQTTRTQLFNLIVAFTLCINLVFR